jgi:hypothetical protein
LNFAHIGVIESELLVKRRRSRDSIKMHEGALGKARQGSGAGRYPDRLGHAKIKRVWHIFSFPSVCLEESEKDTLSPHSSQLSNVGENLNNIENKACGQYTTRSDQISDP